MAWLRGAGIPLVLAVVFGSAALAKARAFAGFVGHLRVPFHRAAGTIARGVIGIEVGLALGLIAAPTSPIVLLATGSFVVVATAFIAWRLLPSDETTCWCWGVRHTAHPLDFSSRPATSDVLASVLAPAWFGVRNGGLLLGIWLLLERSGAQGSPSCWQDFAAFATGPLLLLIGLIASIARRRRFLAREEHPSKAALAARMAPVVAASWYQGTSVKLTPVGMVPWQLRAGADRASEIPLR